MSSAVLAGSRRLLIRAAVRASHAAALSRFGSPVAVATMRHGNFVPRNRLLSSKAAEEDINIDEVAYGFMASQALFTALETSVFDHIAAAGEGGLSVEALQTMVGILAPRLQTLLTSLVVMKALHRTPEGLYTCSPNTGRYLVQSAKNYYGDYLRLQIGRQFYHTMGALPEAIKDGKAPSYASWFSDPEVASIYTRAQHNGSLATAKYLVKKKLELGNITKMLDVGGGSGAFSYVFAEYTPGLTATVLELPEVCRIGESIRQEMTPDVRDRVSFVELDATSPDWPVSPGEFEVVLMSYISGSVPEPLIVKLYTNAFKALNSGGRLIVHDFMVNDDLQGPKLAALWGLQHVTVNADGLGLCPQEIIDRMGDAGFSQGKFQTMEMIQGMTKVIVGHKA